MSEEETTIPEETIHETSTEEEVEEVELLELSPLELEFFLTRSDIWDKLVRNEISIDDAKKLIDTLYTNLVSLSKASTPIKRGRRKTLKSSKNSP
jgi:hypothetical protein